MVGVHIWSEAVLAEQTGDLAAIGGRMGIKQYLNILQVYMIPSAPCLIGRQCTFQYYNGPKHISQSIKILNFNEILPIWDSYQRFKKSLVLIKINFIYFLRANSKLYLLVFASIPMLYIHV